MVRIARVVLVLLMAGAAIQLPSSPAYAGVLDATCVGTSSATYTPALTNVEQTVTASVSESYAPCTSLSTPGLTSGTLSFTSTISTQCLTLLNGGSVTRHITWNTGQTSMLSGNSSATVVGATFVLVINGSVTAGLFAGDTFVGTVTAPATDITLCTLGLGSVSNLFGVITLEITSI